MKITPIILSGGSGSRLWPLSRKQLPKQYLPLIGSNTMLQETILRLKGLRNLTRPIISCNTEHRFLVSEQCRKIDILKPTIILENIGKNTALAVAIAALQSLKDNQNSILLVLPSDHLIKDIKAFHDSIEIAIKQAEEGKLVTLGVTPTNANTGYGYINFSKICIDGAYQVNKFIEKPNLETAQAYLEDGNYLWNSGMFIFQANTLVKELTRHSPDIIKVAREAVICATQDLDFIRLKDHALSSLPNNSLDCALMEKSKNIVTVLLDAKWNDAGTWASLYNVSGKDTNGNVIVGDVIAQDTTNTYVNANHHLVVTLGVDSLIIVDTYDATFVATQDKAQEVDGIVRALQECNRDEGVFHRKVYRPWGWYNIIETGECFQVKRLYVDSGAKLSLQMHEKRAEHWVVVRGVAEVTKNKKELTLQKGDSIDIPKGTVHRLENKTNEPLEVIEIQSGLYLGEDDITRFEDL
jgi:mannose-1-phosphate guanylyltransferase/mannose-6-phosphate isomerase